MNPLDAILSALVDSAFPIVKEVPYAQDSISLFRSLNPVIYGGSPKRAGTQAVADLPMTLALPAAVSPNESCCTIPIKGTRITAASAMPSTS